MGLVLVALAIVSLSLCGKWVGVGADMHHVVGGDRGWDSSTDMASSWSSGRTFRVGDKISFTHSAVQGRIAELETKEEYESCDVTNPIRMYLDGLDSVLLDEEGIRYFVSSNSIRCKKGMKIHVEVIPPQPSDHDDDSQKESTSDDSPAAFADGPNPSGSVQLDGSFFSMVAGLWVAAYVIFIMVN